MSKVSLKDLVSELKKCNIGIDSNSIEETSFWGVHHVHEWDHGYENWHGINVYPDGRYEANRRYIGTRREFYADFQDIINFLLSYIRHCRISEFIIAPCYRYNQFARNVLKNDIYEEIFEFLKSHNIRRGERSGVRLLLQGNEKLIEMIVEGAFRGISELCAFFPSKAMLLAPNHHFGLAFFTRNFELEKDYVIELLKNHPDLRFYEKKCF